MLIAILCAFIGYVVGRASHVIAHDRHIQAVHHWIWGIVILITGLTFLHGFWEHALMGFGVGLAISDFNDMIHIKIYGVQKFEKQKFWSFK